MIKKAAFLFLLSTQVFAQPNGSQASAASMELSGQGIGEIVQGSFHLLQGGSQLPIAGLRIVGDSAYVTLRIIDKSSTLTLKIASTVAK